MNFSDALVFIKEGHKLSRAGWNGANMFVYLVPGSTFNVSRPPLLGIYKENTLIDYRDHIDMKYADGTCGVWAPSMSDLLANDWVLP